MNEGYTLNNNENRLLVSDRVLNSPDINSKKNK